MKISMKKLSFLLIGTLLMLTACGGKKDANQETYTSYDYSQEFSQDGIHRMSDYNYSDSIRTADKKYVYTIHRAYSDSLKVVTDDDDNKYADNIYTLTIQSEGQTIFRREFTKANFLSHLSKEFQEKGLLDGMIYDNTLPGLSFAISVSLPQSDMVEPLIMRVYPKEGGIDITHDDRGEAEMGSAEDSI